MACDLTDISNIDCPEVGGGILESRVTPCSNIEDVTFDANGQVTNFTLGSDPWSKFVFDKDDTAYYNQEGDRVTPRMHVYTQTSFMKFAGIDNTKVQGAKKLRKCCCVVAVHKLGNGKTIVQGVEQVPGGGTTDWQFSKTETTAKVNIMSDTGANEDRVEITLAGKSYEESAITTLKITDLDV